MKNALNIKTLLISLFFLFIGCKNETEKFDSSKWQPVENGLYGKNYRKKMLNDLIKNVLKFPKLGNEIGTKKSEVQKLIGKAHEQDCNGYDLYQIEEKQGWIDPNGFINLKLMYHSDSTLIGYIIEDGNYKE